MSNNAQVNFVRQQGFPEVGAPQWPAQGMAGTFALGIGLFTGNRAFANRTLPWRKAEARK